MSGKVTRSVIVQIAMASGSLEMMITYQIRLDSPVQHAHLPHSPIQLVFQPGITRSQQNSSQIALVESPQSLPSQLPKGIHIPIHLRRMVNPILPENTIRYVPR